MADLNNGTYSATLTSSKTAGSAVVTGSVAGTAIGSNATVAFVAGPAAAIAISNSASNGQTAIVGAAVTIPPSVKVADANGNGVAGQTVTFSVSAGGGTLTGATQTTDATGVATAGSWKLGPVAGPNAVAATVTTAAAIAEGSQSTIDRSVTFTATGIAGSPGSISLNGGDGQTAVAGSLVATPPSVKVVDGNNNPVSGATVNFVLGSAGGTVTDGAAVTNSLGIATVGSWRLGPIAGAYTLIASTPGVSGLVTFSASGIAGPAATIGIANPASNGQSVTAGSDVAILPSVKVTDVNGNAVGGVSVTFAVGSSSGSLTGGSQTTNASGIATVGSWTLNAIAGTNTLTASSGSLSGSPVTFTATGTSGAAGALIPNGGDGQTAIAGSPVTTAPSVKVQDINGNPVAGAAVTFAVLSGGGSVTGANAVSNALGVATLGSWTLGTAAGQNTLSASSGSITPVTFGATGIAGAAAKIAINAGNDQSAPLSTAVAVAPSVKITDANGNAVAGTTVTFSVASGGGSITGASATSDANGIATIGTWTLGPAAGVNSLTATSTGLAGSPITFGATALSPPPLAVAVTGTLERSEKVSVTVTQNGTLLAPGSYSLAFVPSDGATNNGDGTVTLLKGGSLTINASVGSSTGTTNVTVVTPPSVVFDLLTDGNRDIWRVALDGQDLQQLTTDPADDQHPSAAAGKLMFASAREGNLHVYVVPLSGGTPVKVTPNSSADTEPRISRNGQRFAYINNESGLGRAMYANIDGSNPLPVANNSGNTGAIEFSPDWSPNSDKVVFGSTAAGAADIYFANTLGGTAAYFAANSTTKADLQPVYSPDGQRVAFVSNRAGSTADIYIANIDGSGVVKVASNASGPAWARGDRLVFETVIFTPGQPLRGTLHWIDPSNPGVIHDIAAGAGDARNASPIF